LPAAARPLSELSVPESLVIEPPDVVVLPDVAPLGELDVLDVAPPGDTVLVDVPPLGDVAVVDADPEVLVPLVTAPAPPTEPAAPACIPPLALPPLPMSEELVPLVDDPLGDALGLLVAWASRLHASKSAWVGSAANAAPHTATTLATVRSAVARLIVLMVTPS
jgi:hypothetical protein